MGSSAMMIAAAQRRGSSIPISVTPETWSPLNLPSLHAWWSMQGTGTIRATSSGSGSGNLQTLITNAVGQRFITQIDDLSGNGNHLQQTTDAKQPEALGIVNSKWTCDFDGTDDFLDVASPTDLTQPNTIVLAFQILSKLPTNPNLFIAGMTTGFNHSISKHNTNDFYRFSAGNPTDTAMEVDLTAPRIVTATFRPNSLSVAYMNTTQIVETPYDVGSQTFRAARVGAGTNSDNYSNIRFLEAIILDTNINTSDLALVVAYLQNKWAISTSLPGGTVGDETFAVDTMPGWYHCSYRVKRIPYLSGAGVGAGGAELTLRYREAGTTTWKTGAGTLLIDDTPGGAWFEPNAGFNWVWDNDGSSHAARGTTYLTAANGGADFLDEWRGHIIGLSPNKTYDLEITIDPTGLNITSGVQFKTWPLAADLPGTVLTLNTSYNAGLKFSDIPDIGNGGTAESWKIIEPASGGTTIAPNGGEYMLYPDLPFVAFRPNGNDRFHLTRGTSDVARGVFFETIAATDNKQHDIILEGLDIEQWGTHAPAETAEIGRNAESGIGTLGQADYSNYGKKITRIGIRQCTVSNPRYRSLYWGENPDNSGGHPEGPSAVNFNGVGPVIVLAECTLVGGAGGAYSYDDVCGGHGLQVVVGYGATWGIGSYVGRNYMKDSFDDAIEADGHGFLVVEQNWFDNFYNCMSSQPASIGPMWWIGNIAGRDSNQGQFGKMQNCTTAQPWVISGRVFVVGNTAIGGAQAVDNGFGKRGCTGIVYRNNIMITESNSPSFSIQLLDGDSPGKLYGGSLGNVDYDMYYVVDIRRPIAAKDPPEPNGINMNIEGEPTFVDDDGTINGDYRITAASVGKNAGQQIPGVTIVGDTTPDMGLGGLVSAMPTIGAS